MKTFEKREILKLSLLVLFLLVNMTSWGQNDNSKKNHLGLNINPEVIFVKRTVNRYKSNIKLSYNIGLKTEYNFSKNLFLEFGVSYKKRVYEFYIPEFYLHPSLNPISEEFDFVTIKDKLFVSNLSMPILCKFYLFESWSVKFGGTLDILINENRDKEFISHKGFEYVSLFNGFGKYHHSWFNAMFSIGKSMEFNKVIFELSTTMEYSFHNIRTLNGRTFNQIGVGIQIITWI